MKHTKHKPVTLDHVQIVNLRAMIQNVQNMIVGLVDGQTDFTHEIQTLKEIAENTELPKELKPL